MMIVTFEQLENADACREALAAFRQAVGERTADVEFNPAAQGLMLADPMWRQWFGWAVWRRIIPAWSMADLNLYHADLRYANLYRADLSLANLYQANLSEANLRYANLSEADLYRADLRYANLYHADLREANLRYANLRYANLRYANLYRADLSEARYNQYTIWTVGFEPQEAGAVLVE